MPVNNADELFVPGDGQLYTADIGTPLPALNSDPAADLNAGFQALGYWTDDGATFTQTPDIKEFTAFQALNAIRRRLNRLDVSLAVVLQQWNENTVPTALGGTIEAAGGFTTYRPPAAGDAVPEVSVVADLQDGDRLCRIVFPRANTATEAVTATFKKDEASPLPVTAKVLDPTDGSDPFYILFNDDAFAVGS